MTACILKQTPNTSKVKKNACLLWHHTTKTQKHHSHKQISSQHLIFNCLSVVLSLDKRGLPWKCACCVVSYKISNLFNLSCVWISFVFRNKITPFYSWFKFWEQKQPLPLPQWQQSSKQANKQTTTKTKTFVWKLIIRIVVLNVNLL